MDVKVTLSFDEQIVLRAKEFAEEQNISLSRLIEFMLRKATSKPYTSLDDLPVSDWVSMVAEGPAEYKRTPPSSKNLKAEYLSSKKRTRK